MSLNKLPNENIKNIIDFLEIDINELNKTILKEIKKIFNFYYKIILINKNFRFMYYINYKKILYMIYLMNKYHIYQNDYERYLSNNLVYFIGSPQLYDLLCTGMKKYHIKSSVKIWNREQYTDFFYILNYFPSCMKFNKSYFKNIQRVPILYIACINENIPIKLIQLLIDYGAYWNDYLLVNSHKISIVQHLRFNLSNSRYNELSKICDLL